MEANILKVIPNSGTLKTTGKIINLRQGRYIYCDISHPLSREKELFYERVYSLEHKSFPVIYWLDSFGEKSEKHGNHIGLSNFQNHIFLWKQKKHWLQQENNIRYIINIVFLTLGLIIGIMNIKYK